MKCTYEKTGGGLMMCRSQDREGGHRYLLLSIFSKILKNFKALSVF